jgi:D-alanyl-lipoteichoic acid acyltransferase DltB (MBOAT superfamily)
VLFPTLTFAIFFLVVFPISWWLRPHQRSWRLFMLAASYVFYGSWDWRFVFLLFASSVVNAFLGRMIAAETRAGRRGYLVAAVAFNVGLLGVFKYYGFFVESLNGLLTGLGLPGQVPFLEIILPVGISFFTFQAISYVVDIHRRQIEPVPWLDFAVFLAFFPHLVAGPIVRAAEFLPQVPVSDPLRRADASRAALLIARGLFMKVVVSSYLASTIVDPVFAVPSRYSALEILVAVYGYAVQIYADFSGYTDIAIGLALLLGIEFPQNFNRPYAAVSIQDFWRRWHMTLSRWLRDYLYIPLGGNRHGEVRTYLNLLITMGLGGLWHGASMNFVLWGLYQGAGLIAQRWYHLHRVLPRRLRRPQPAVDRPALTRWAGWLATFNFVCLGWVLFRADSLATAGLIVQRGLTAWGPAPAVSLGLVLVIAAAVGVQLLPPGLGQRFEGSFARLPLPVQGVALGVFLALVVALGPEGVAPFIYFRF